MKLATRFSDGRPLTLADVAEFIADVAAAGVPAVEPLLVTSTWTAGECPAPIVEISVRVTDEQAAALPDHIEITTASAPPALQEV